MDTSLVRGLVFMGILLIASLLLADPKRLKLWAGPDRRVWLLRPGYGRKRRAVDRVLLAIFCSLCGWLVYSHSEANRNSVVRQARAGTAVMLPAR
jgi:predicted RNA methylase